MYFYVICEVARLILRRRSPAPESGCSIKIGLYIYLCYVCTNWRGLSAFSGALDSILRCAGGVGRPDPLTWINDLIVPRSCSFYSLPWYPLHIYWNISNLVFYCQLYVHIVHIEHIANQYNATYMHIFSGFCLVIIWFISPRAQGGTWKRKLDCTDITKKPL